MQPVGSDINQIDIIALTKFLAGQLPTGGGRVFDYRETWGSASEIFSGTARMTTWRWASESSP